MSEQTLFVGCQCYILLYVVAERASYYHFSLIETNKQKGETIFTFGTNKKESLKYVSLCGKKSFHLSKTMYKLHQLTLLKVTDIRETMVTLFTLTEIQNEIKCTSPF